MRSIILTVRTIFSLTGLALLPAAGPAHAQSNRDAVTEISFNLNGVYEDNVARASDLIAAQRGLEQKDFIVSPTVSLDIVRMIGTSSVELRGQLGYSFYAKNSELDRERIGLRAKGDVPLGPCRVGPEVGLQRRQTDLRDIAFLPGVGADLVTNTETIQTYGVAIACGRDPGLRPFVGIEYEDADNSAALRERSEYESVTYRAGLRYSSAALGEVSLFGSRRDTDLSVAAFGAGGEPKTKFDEIGVEIKRDIGSRVQATASLSYSRLDSDNVLIDEFKGLVWDVSLTALIGANLRVTAGTGREVGSSLASDAGFVVSTPHRVRLEYAFSDRARFDLAGSIIDRRFGFGSNTSPLAITNETQRRIDGGLTYNLGRRFNVRLFGGYEERNANGTLFDYGASFAGASIGLRF